VFLIHEIEGKVFPLHAMKVYVYLKLLDALKIKHAGKWSACKEEVPKYVFLFQATSKSQWFKS
jgi:hypothetical protein